MVICTGEATGMVEFIQVGKGGDIKNRQLFYQDPHDNRSTETKDLVLEKVTH